VWRSEILEASAEANHDACPNTDESARVR
jgi:hypothetical protein